MAEEEVLQRLAHVFDAESRPVFVSVFADLSDPMYRTRLDRRAREIEAAIEPDAKPLFREAWEAAQSALEGEAAKDGTRGVAVFAAPEHALLEALGLTERVSTRLVLDSSPYIRPLARFLDEHERFVLLLLDGQDAAVYVVEAATPRLESSPDTRPMSRHRKGGMSQARFQRHRDGVMNKFFDEVSDEVLRVARATNTERIIVAGPGQPKRLFVERAPRELQDLIIAEEDVDFKAGAEDPVLAQRFVEVARKHAHEMATKDLERLRTGLRTGEGSVTGAFDAIDAAQTGRVATLIVLTGHKVAALKCEEHQTVLQPGSACVCGNKGNTVDAINEAIEFTLRQGGKVEFVAGDAFLESLGGVGAILRF